MTLTTQDIATRRYDQYIVCLAEFGPITGGWFPSYGSNLYWELAQVGFGDSIPQAPMDLCRTLLLRRAQGFRSW